MQTICFRSCGTLTNLDESIGHSMGTEQTSPKPSWHVQQTLLAAGVLYELYFTFRRHRG